MQLQNWPAITDAATPTDLTATHFDKNFYEAIKDSVEGNLHSYNNPTIKGKNFIDEIVAARGNKANLNSRIVGVITADGVLDAPATVKTLEHLESVPGRINLIRGGDFLMWPNGSNGVNHFPANFGTWISGATYTQCGVGLADTTQKVGPYCCKVTHSGAPGTQEGAYTTICDNTAGTTYDFFKWAGEKTPDCRLGCWIKSNSGPNKAFILLYDAAAATYAYDTVGDGTWQWVELSHPYNAAGTCLHAYIGVQEGGVVGYFSGMTATINNKDKDFPIGDYVPAPLYRDVITIQWKDTPQTGSYRARICMPTAYMIDQVETFCRVAPGGTGLTGYLQKHNGAGWDNLFSGTKTLIPNGSKFARQVCDGDYDHRCFLAGYYSTIANALCDVYFDSVDAAIKDVYMNIHVIGYGHMPWNWHTA